MSKLIRCSALFLLAVAVSSGCITQPEKGGNPDVLRNIQSFEKGRRAELQKDYRTAVKEYNGLIERSSRYGDYGQAMLKLKREPSNRESVKYLLDCAERSDHTFKFSFNLDSPMDSAFSAAAMDKLAEIAITEHGRRDIADSLREMMSGIVTKEVKAWADAMKTNSADSAIIYENVISAVESCRQRPGYVKVLKWDEISKVLLNEELDDVTQTGGDGVKPVQPSQLPTLVKFDKVQGATCRYDFEVRLAGNGTIKATTAKVRSEIRSVLVKEFLDENGYNGVDDVRTSFPSWHQSGVSIKGSVVAFKMSVVKGEYDENTGGGKIVVQLDGRDMKAALKWVRENIAELVGDKNVTLVAGKPPPPGAHYKIGSERITENGRLEVEFNTRE